MALLTTHHIQLKGVATSVPSKVVSNRDLTIISDEDKKLLIQTTGIEKRRVAENQTSESLCIAAAEKLLSALNWDRSEIEILIFVTQTPFQPIPGSSSKIQSELGLSKNCMTLDINQGCAGYVYGLSVISSMMEAGRLKKGLLLVGDVITKELDEKDQSTSPIFSDAGSATALEYSEEKSSMHFNLQADGTGFEVIHQAKGGAMKMNGPAVFNFGLKEVASNINDLLSNAEKEIDEVDFVVMHQANKLLNAGIRRRLKISSDKVPYSIGNYGNTSCATIPVTLVDQLKENLRNEKIQLILSGFGVGLSWGSVILTTNKIVCPEMIIVQ